MVKRKKKDFFEQLDVSAYEQTTPRCEHFGSCGGCRFQNISYAVQLELKKEFLKSIFKQDVSLFAAPNEYGYRNRMDFVYSLGGFGLRRRGDFKTVVDITTCHLIPHQVQEVFTKVKELIKEYVIPEYDYLEHVGFLRYVVFRYAPLNNELMLLFTTSSGADDALQKKFNVLLQDAAKLAQSVQWFENETITDVSIPPVEPRLILGTQTITESIGDLQLSFSAHSFFQNNSAMTKTIFDDIKKHVQGNTVDLCCGVGAITLFVADKASSIIGIEEVPQAIKLAKENAKQNNLSNAKFFTAPMKKFLDYAPMDVDTIILDPPRGGVGKKVISKILAAQPTTIVYMSCNPKSQYEDMQFLFTDGYELAFLQTYDFFPQTPHVETLAVFKRG